jgi:hypothetical protein
MSFHLKSSSVAERTVVLVVLKQDQKFAMKTYNILIQVVEIEDGSSWQINIVLPMNAFFIRTYDKISFTLYIMIVES